MATHASITQLRCTFSCFCFWFFGEEQAGGSVACSNTATDFGELVSAVQPCRSQARSSQARFAVTLRCILMVAVSHAAARLTLVCLASTRPCQGRTGYMQSWY